MVENLLSSTIGSGQITTSAEVTPNGGLVRESPQYPLNSGLGIIVICPDWVNPTVKFVLQNRSQERNTSTHTIFETSKYIWVVISNMFYFHPEPWGNDPI